MEDWSRAADALRAAVALHMPALRHWPDREWELDGTAREADVRPLTIRLERHALRPALFDYQRDLSEQVVALLEERRSGLLALPTGAGKTRTAVVGLLSAYVQSYVSRTVWLAPSIELVDQAAATFEAVWREFGRVGDLLLERGSDPPRADAAVWLATPQAVYAKSRRGRSLGDWDAVVFDEAHQLGARTYRAAVDRLRRSGNGRRVGVLGLSATPGRISEDETEDLVDLFDGRLLRSRRLAPNPVVALQRRGVLARLKFEALEPVAPGDLVGRFLRIAEVAREVAGRGGRLLAFTSSVPEAIVLSEVISSAGLPALAVHSLYSGSARRAALDAFARGDVRGLVSQRLLATGFDAPGVTDLVLVTRIGSPILFEQIIGRAARGPRVGGSPTAVVWDFDDNLGVHGFPKSYYRYQEFDWR